MKSKLFIFLLCIPMFTAHAGVDPNESIIATPISKEDTAANVERIRQGSSSTVGESTDSGFSPLLKECLETQEELAHIRRKQLKISNTGGSLYDLRNEYNKVTAKILFLKALQKLAQEFANITGEIADYSKQKESLKKNQAKLKELLDEHARTIAPLKTLQDIFKNGGDINKVLSSGFGSDGKAQSADPAKHIIDNMRTYCRASGTPDRIVESDTCAAITNDADDAKGIKGIIELAYQIAQANANEVSGITGKHISVDYDLFKTAINELKDITPLYIKEADFEKYSQLNQQLQNQVNDNNYEKVDDYVALIQKDLKQSHASQNKVNPNDVDKIRMNLENALLEIEQRERNQASKPSDISNQNVDLKDIINGKNGKYSNLQMHFAKYHYFYLENKDGTHNGKSKDNAFKEFINGHLEDFYKNYDCEYDSATLTSATTLKSCLQVIANGKAAALQADIKELEDKKMALAARIVPLERTPLYQGLDYFSYILTKFLKDNCLRTSKSDAKGLVCTLDGKEYPEVLNASAEYFLNDNELIVSKLIDQGSLTPEQRKKSCEEVLADEEYPIRLCESEEIPIIGKECSKECDEAKKNKPPVREENPLPETGPPVVDHSINPCDEEYMRKNPQDTKCKKPEIVQGEVGQSNQYEIPVEESVPVYVRDTSSTQRPTPPPPASGNRYETGDSSSQNQSSSSGTSAGNRYETDDDGYEEVRYRNDAIRRGRYCGGPRHRRRYNSDRYWRELRRDPYMGNDYLHYEQRQGTGSMVMSALTNTVTPSSTMWNTNPNWMNIYQSYNYNKARQAQAESEAYWRKQQMAQWQAMMASRYNGRHNGGYNGGYYPTPAGASPFYWGYNRGTYYQKNLYDPAIPNIGTGF